MREQSDALAPPAPRGPRCPRPPPPPPPRPRLSASSPVRPPRSPPAPPEALDARAPLVRRDRAPAGRRRRLCARPTHVGRSRPVYSLRFGRAVDRERGPRAELPAAGRERADDREPRRALLGEAR